MINSILNVHKNFFSLFQKVDIGKGGYVHCRYYKKSSNDYTEEQQQQEYPCIVIQDYAPKLDYRAYVDQKKYQGATNLKGTLIELLRRPLWMDFVFDVSIVAKSYFDYQKLQDYFLQNFLSKTSFIFNKEDLSDLGEGEVGDVVPYEISVTDVPRTDGCFETNFQFTLLVWIAITASEEVDAIKNIIHNVDDASDGVEREDNIYIELDNWILETGVYTDEGKYIGSDNWVDKL